MSKITRLLADPPKGRKSGLRSPEGWYFRLTHDTAGTDKLEDEHPLNTFVEIYLAIGALAALFAGAVTIASEVLQGIAAYKELFGR